MPTLRVSTAARKRCQVPSTYIQTDTASQTTPATQSMCVSRTRATEPLANPMQTVQEGTEQSTPLSIGMGALISISNLGAAQECYSCRISYATGRCLSKQRALGWLQGPAGWGGVGWGLRQGRGMYGSSKVQCTVVMSRLDKTHCAAGKTCGWWGGVTWVGGWVGRAGWGGVGWIKGC